MDAPDVPHLIAADLREIIGKLRRLRPDDVLPGNLNWAQVTALSVLEREGPMTVTALALFEHVRPQSMGVNLTVLQSEGYISGAPDPRDGRQTIWSVTPTARKLIKKDRELRDDSLSQAIERSLSAQEQKQLARTIDLVRRVLDDWREHNVPLGHYGGGFTARAGDQRREPASGQGTRRRAK